MRAVRKTLGLDIETERAAAPQREHFLERGDAGAGAGCCPGNAGFTFEPQSQRRSSASVISRMGRAGPGPEQIPAFGAGSCETTNTLSRVTATSSSKTSAPASIAY